MEVIDLFRGILKRGLALSTAVLLTSSIGVSSLAVYADSVPTVTIGADLTEEQREKIFSFFGATEDSVSVIEVNNTQERKYLEGLVSDDVIGTKTLSCSYILPMSSGGIVVKTANLTWVTEGMLANALLTSGVENCQVLATAPFEVSGTGALTGVMLAYEDSSGEVLDESKKELATEELVVTGQLVDELTTNTSESGTIDNNELSDDVEISKYVIEMLNEMKKEALNGNLDEESVRGIVNKYLEKYKIDVTEEMKQKLIDYLMSFSAEDYAKTFKNAIDSLSDRIKGGFNVNININIGSVLPDVSLNAFEQFFINLINWFKYVFNLIDTDIDSVKSIFDNVNTDIIGYDESISGVDNGDTAEGTDIVDTDNSDISEVDNIDNIEAGDTAIPEASDIETSNIDISEADTAGTMQNTFEGESSLGNDLDNGEVLADE